MKKIAIVVPCVHAGGGVPAVAQYLCEILAGYEYQIISVSTAKNDLHSVRLFSPKSWFSGVQLHSSTWNGHNVIDVGACLTEFEFQRYMPRKKLTRLLDEFDIVQVVAGAPAWAYLAKNCQAPVFLQSATLVKEERRQLISDSGGFKKLYLLMSTYITSVIERRALSFVNLVFVENFWMYEYLRKLIGEDKVVMAPPGIDTNKYRPKDNEPSSTNADKYLISVGRFNDRRKNVRLLFEAYQRIRRINSNPPLLLLVGLSGPTNEDWAYAKRLGIDEFISFKPDISNNELISLLQNAEIFVSSSDEEGLGIAMMEALACGIPVVSTLCGGPETFMEEGVNGYLVPRNNAELLATRIDQLLTNDALKKQMGLNARKIIHERFSNEATGRIFRAGYFRQASLKPFSEQQEVG